MVFVDCQLLTFVIISPSGLHTVALSLYFIVWGMMEMVTYFVGYSRKIVLIYAAGLLT